MCYQQPHSKGSSLRGRRHIHFPPLRGGGGGGDSVVEVSVGHFRTKGNRCIFINFTS